jgi:hypothetical protein
LKKTLLILTALYFLLGNCLIPQGDFSVLSQLPAMYQHCQRTEDPAMNLADFITDHLLNLDEVFNESEEADEHELPHNPVPFHTTNATVFFCVHVPQIILLPADKPVVQNQADYHSPYFSRLNQHEIFQPPRV